ncbi:MAG: hypothetical protein ACK55I_44350, partial [bacterium]
MRLRELVRRRARRDDDKRRRASRCCGTRRDGEGFEREVAAMRSKTLDCGSLLPLVQGSPAA